MPRTRIGISGWSYEKWRGDFYPEGLPRGAALDYLGSRLNSVEVNGTFYSLQKPDTYRRWYEQTPPDFLFAVKGGRYITHNKKLADVETALANFLAQGLLLLREKLGPILWQLPGNMVLREERVAEFLDLLPRDTEAAARLASRHDHRVEGRSSTEPGGRRRLRHVIEPRHESFFTPGFVRLARRSGVAIAFSDAADWPLTEEVTAGFVYLRLHGSTHTYASRYTEDELDAWAARIRKWRAGEEPVDAARITDRAPPPRKGRDVYVYFDNDAEGHAPHDALRLAGRVGPDPEPAGAE